MLTFLHFLGFVHRFVHLLFFDRRLFLGRLFPFGCIVLGRVAPLLVRRVRRGSPVAVVARKVLVLQMKILKVSTYI